VAAEPYCERCDLPLSQCEHRLPPPEPVPAWAQRVPSRYMPGDVYLTDYQRFWEGIRDTLIRGSGLGPWVVAEWHGRCKACGERWEPGERIRGSSDDGGFICETCGTE
jgi:hypothetical protein